MPLSRRLLFRWELPEDFVVTPWDVKGQVDYDRLVTQFGTQRLTQDLLEQIRKAAGELHPMLRRGVFYSHRDLDWILREYGKGNRYAFSTPRAVVGFENSNTMGELSYTGSRAAPAFRPAGEAGHEVPVLIPCGIDQAPHFRVARDVAPKLGYPKPALIHNKLLPSLLGPTGKMSASIPESSIFTTDTEAQAQKKIMNAFTGGRATVEEQRRLGANPYICSIFAQYNYIFEPDDGHLAEVERTCKSGERLCGDCKTELWGKVRPWLNAHHAAREKAKDRLEQFVVRD